MTTPVEPWWQRFQWWHEVVLASLLLGLLAAATWAMPRFTHWPSQLILSRHLWEAALIALPMTLIIITGGIDLSVGSTMGLCAVVFGITYQRSGSLAASCIACLVTGIGCGFVNGSCITRLRVHPLIITLSTYAAFRGMAEGISQGASYSQFGDVFGQVARGGWGGLPFAGWAFAALALAFAVYLTQTPGGRWIYAIGHNERAARFSGVPVDRVKRWLYVLSGAFAALATLVYISRFDTAKADAGTAMELDVITAVVIGGTSIYGGRGNILGTTLGLLLIHEAKLFVGRYWQVDELKSIFVGVLLIASVMVYRCLTPTSQE